MLFVPVELVLQMRANIRIPELAQPQRLREDALRRSDTNPVARYFADLEPLPPKASENAGPGARSKSPSGEWLRQGKYAEEKFVRR